MGLESVLRGPGGLGASGAGLTEAEEGAPRLTLAASR
jgi:hypothetical protein